MFHERPTTRISSIDRPRTPGRLWPRRALRTVVAMTMAGATLGGETTPAAADDSSIVITDVAEHGLPLSPIEKKRLSDLEQADEVTLDAIRAAVLPAEIPDIADEGEPLSDEEIQRLLDLSDQVVLPEIITGEDGTFGDLTPLVDQRKAYYKDELGFKPIGDKSLRPTYQTIVDVVSADPNFQKTAGARARMVNILALLDLPPTDYDKVKSLTVPRTVDTGQDASNKAVKAAIDKYVKDTREGYRSDIFTDLGTSKVTDAYTAEQIEFFLSAMACAEVETITDTQWLLMAGLDPDDPTVVTPPEAKPSKPPAPKKPEQKKSPNSVEKMRYALNKLEKQGGDIGRQATIALYLSNRDPRLSIEHLAGIIGNCHVESKGCKSDTRQKNGNAIGIFQWDSRRASLEAYAKSKGKPWHDFNTQLAFTWYEMTGSERKNYERFVKEGGPNADKTAPGRVAKSTDKFMKYFERPHKDPAVNHIDRRIKAARKFYDAYQEFTHPERLEADASATRARMVEIARSQLGVTEDPLYCDRGGGSILHKDCGPVNRYTGKGVVYYWCAAFATWVMKEANAPYTGDPKKWRITGVKAFDAMGVAAGRAHEVGSGYTPQPGDAITFNRSHVALVEGYDPKTRTITYIGGNQTTGYSGRNGVAVTRATVKYAPGHDIMHIIEPRIPK
ncbi:hypothetical protein CR983_01245 [Candidatus Saccharibacteria bacterium]|nr:MAG: hypothetical protein CR983_01245 [Candidatus Saccharibacteria bacterium]